MIKKESSAERIKKGLIRKSRSIASKLDSRHARVREGTAMREENQERVIGQTLVYDARSS